MGVAFSLVALGGSQVLRFAAHERTAMTSLALRAVPTSLRPHTAAGAERQVAEMDLPPLPDGPRRPEADVLLITIDALRADHVGAYGYKRATTPHIDRLAAAGVRFARAYSQAPHTSFSVASMLTGKYFPTLARLAPGESHEPIAAVLRTYGWRTAAFYPPAVFYVDAAKTKVYAATQLQLRVRQVRVHRRPAPRRSGRSPTTTRSSRERSFVWIHFFEPHEPYETHAGFSFGAGDIDRYDSEIAYTDAAVGRLVAEARKRRPGTIVVVAADHGEEFDEHGGRYHGSTLYEEQLHVPLIVSVPGVAPRRRLRSGRAHRRHADGAQPARHPGPGAHARDRPRPLARDAARARVAPAAGLRRGRGSPHGRLARREAHLRPALGLLRLLRSRRRPARDAQPRRGKARARRRHARACSITGSTATCGSSRSWRAAHRTPRAAPCPRPSSADASAICWPLPELGALMIGGGPLAQRREAAQLLVGLPPRRETAAALARAAADADPIIADWAAVGAVRIGDVGARARVQVARRRGRARRGARSARACRARARGRRRPERRPGPRGRARSLRRRAAVPAHHLEPRPAARRARRPGPARAPARGPEPARDGGRARRDRRSRGARRARRAAARDEYVPVRVQRPPRSPKLGDPSAIPALEQRPEDRSRRSSPRRARRARALAAAE